ncbi:MAG: peptide deformylase [Deltaproteobacteria bacterium]|nr:peptide deformylase [Deltaproteobacteria bacterium]
MRRALGILLVVLSPIGCGAPAAPASSPAPAPSPSASAAPDIVQIGQPVLRSRAEEVPKERIATPEFQALVARMIDTMRKAPGVGLAAPQIGVPLRVIVLEDREELMSKLTPEERKERERFAFGPRVFVNPVLRPISDGKDDRATFFEGCLSVRGYVGLVERSREVEVTGLDEHGVEQVWRVKGWPARILQHEVDHLDGTLYVDRMFTRSFSNADEAKKRFAGKPIAEVRKLLGS